MAPAEFFIKLQRGITGGFAPPTPSAIYTIVASPQPPNTILISAAKRPDGQPQLSAAAEKSVSLGENAKLIDELETILKGLPIENPPGSEDIYGLDISILYGSANVEWANGGPAGCSGGTSAVHATAEQKAQFKRAVEIVSHLVGE